MAGITLDPADEAELAETLTFLTCWLSGSQKQALAKGFTAFVGHPAYNHRGPLHRPPPVRLPPPGAATAKDCSTSRLNDPSKTRLTHRA